VLLVAEVAQAAVGYTQYFTGVPALLVAIHVVGALAVWIAVVRLRLSVWARTAIAAESPGPPPASVLVPA
jgi:cytochrome c oxidase assembly protein subunit 15